MTKQIYRVAIIGLGRMGSTIDTEMAPGTPAYSVAAACAASDRLEVVAGADTDPAKRAAFQERWGVETLYADYVEMIRQEKPDMVAICTLGPLHAEMAVKSAEMGVPMIFCEKAIACSCAEADAVLAAVTQHKTLFNTGVLRRFNHTFHAAKALIDAGEIGEVRTVVHYAASNLLHGHIHSLDTISYLLGDPKVVSVWGELSPRDLVIENNRLDKDPNCIYQVLFANGVEATTVPGGKWEFEVIGTQGSVRVLNNSEGIWLRKANKEHGGAFETVPVDAIPPHSTTQYCLEDLVAAHEEGRSTLGPVEICHHLTEVCIAVAESHRLQQRVTLPLVNRDFYIYHR